jgi:DNA primase
MTTPLEDALRDRGIEVRSGGTHQNVRSGWIGVDCMDCGPNSGRFHLGINPERGMASCWRCGGKSLQRVVAQLLGVSWAEAGEILGNASDRPRFAQDRSERRGRLVEPPGLEPLSGRLSAYLRGRGFAVPELKRLWGLQGIGIAGRLSWRIYIPIVWGGKVVSWTSRSIAENPRMRYLGAKPEQEAVAAKSILYGGDYVRNSVVICEGATDVWRLGPGAVATLGMSWTAEQFAWLAWIPVRAVCFDNEPEAQKRARRLADDLAVFPGRTEVVEIETGDDVADADAAEVEEIRRLYLED